MTEKLNQPFVGEIFNFEPENEVYLEIGYGTDPSALSGNRVFTDGKVYVGVDVASSTNYEHIVKGDSQGNYGDIVREEMSEFVKEARVKHPDQDIRFSIGNGEDLPIDNDRISEVYAANVLTSISAKQRLELIEEIKRILKPGGSLVVKTSWDSWLWPQTEIESLLEGTGLEVVSSIDATSDNFGETEETYGTSRGIERRVGYFVVAQKPVVEAEV